MERSSLIRNSILGLSAVLALGITSVFTLNQKKSQSQAQAATQVTIAQVLQQNGISSDTVQNCPEGISEPIMRTCGEPQCSGGSDPATSVNTAGGGVANVTKPVCTVSIEFTGVRCMDGSVVDYKPFGEGCVQATKEEFSTRFAEVGDEMRSLCAGKKAPSCGGTSSSGTETGTGTGTGTTGNQVNNSNTSSQGLSGDVNGDGVVDLLDYSVWLNAFTSTAK